MLRFETLDGADVEREWSRIEGPLVDAYVSIFNNDWKESWTPESARERLRSNLRRTPGRHPVIALTWEGDRVIAFATGNVLTRLDVIDDNDLPAYYSLRPEQLDEAVSTIRRSAPLPFSLGNGWAVRPEHRDPLTLLNSYLPFFERCKELGCEQMLGWTSRRTRAFYLYMAARCEVIYDFNDPAQLCFFSAPLRYLLAISQVRHLPGIGVAVGKAILFATLLRRGLIAAQGRYRLPSMSNGTARAPALRTR